MVDPDRHLADPGIDDSPTDAEIKQAADDIDVTEWVVGLADTCDSDAALLRWARECYREIMDAVERGRE